MAAESAKLKETIAQLKKENQSAASKPTPAPEVTLARQVQSLHDKKESLFKAIALKRKNLLAELELKTTSSDRRNDICRELLQLKATENRENAIRQAQVDYERNQPPGVFIPDNTSPFKTYNITRHKYYVGYHDAFGVVIATQYNGVWVPEQLLQRKKPSMQSDFANEKYNHLTRSDFDNILKTQPTIEQLKYGYVATVKQNPLENVLKRMSLVTATVLF